MTRKGKRKGNKGGWGGGGGGGGRRKAPKVQQVSAKSLAKVRLARDPTHSPLFHTHHVRARILVCSVPLCPVVWSSASRVGHVQGNTCTQTIVYFFRSDFAQRELTDGYWHGSRQSVRSKCLEGYNQRRNRDDILQDVTEIIRGAPGVRFPVAALQQMVVQCVRCKFCPATVAVRVVSSQLGRWTVPKMLTHRPLCLGCYRWYSRRLRGDFGKLRRHRAAVYGQAVGANHPRIASMSRP